MSSSSETILSISLLETHSPVGFAGFKGQTDFVYTGPKPGGTEIGHCIIHGLTNKPYLIKTGASLSLFHNSLKVPEKTRMFLGFLVTNYSRITGEPFYEEQVMQLKAILEKFLITVEGQHLNELVKTNQVITSRNLYHIVDYILTQITDPALKDVIGLSLLSDVTKGSLSQALSNEFQARQSSLDQLPAAIVISEQFEKGALLYGSYFISDAYGLDTFLLTPFVQAKREGALDWLEQGVNQLSQLLTLNPLTGLCSAILLRHIMGESADNGPDNMLIVENRGKMQVLNIDLTGFRYNRQRAFQDRFGWEETLILTDAQSLIDRLFHFSVFQSRFIKNSGEFSLDEAESLYNCLVDLLKTSLKPQVLTEIRAVRHWLASLDATVLEDFSKAFVQQVADSMSEQLRPSARIIDALIESNKGFIDKAIEVAKSIEQKQFEPDRFFSHRSLLEETPLAGQAMKPN